MVWGSGMQSSGKTQEKLASRISVSALFCVSYSEFDSLELAIRITCWGALPSARRG
jgi:hypothetical protein